MHLIGNVNHADNPSNAIAHSKESIGPEIWEQTEGKRSPIFIVGRYLRYNFGCWKTPKKEKNPDIKIWGIDTYGSVFKKYCMRLEF
jgi:cystathionine beta-synthase